MFFVALSVQVRVNQMGVWEILRFRPRKGVNEKSDPAIDKVADDICRNLRALGLYVESKKYRSGFCEIVASSSRKMITLPDGKEASGIALLLAKKYDPPAVVFEEINSLRAGLGSQMVRAVVAALDESPRVFERLRVNDLSPRMKDGRRWWEHIASSYPEFEWHITHDEDLTHFIKAS
jgi:hypothetical protein